MASIVHCRCPSSMSVKLNWIFLHWEMAKFTMLPTTSSIHFIVHLITLLPLHTGIVHICTHSSRLGAQSTTKHFPPQNANKIWFVHGEYRADTKQTSTHTHSLDIWFGLCYLFYPCCRRLRKPPSFVAIFPRSHYARSLLAVLMRCPPEMHG